MLKFNENQKSIINDFVSVLNKYNFVFSNEKELQEEIEKKLAEHGFSYQREYRLGSKGIIDFYKDGVGFEVKVKGQKQKIYRQCKSYCEHDEINAIVLVTAMPMGLPEKINEKPALLVNIAKNFLF